LTNLEELVLRVDYSSLMTNSIQDLGSAHWYICKAEKIMRGKCEQKIGMVTKETAFSHEVGTNVLRWWIRKRETDLHTLSKKTKETYPILDLLKERTRKFSAENSNKKFQDVIDALAVFCEQNKTEIKKFLEYVKWLFEKDELAPIILDVYPLWSGSRRNNNLLSVSGNYPTEKISELEYVSKIPIGVYIKGSYTLNEFAQEKVYECEVSAKSITSSAIIDDAFNTARYYVLERLRQYFDLMRTSLASILQEIDQYFIEKLYQYDNKFWRKFIEKAKPDKEVERVLWDFKETLFMWAIPRNSPAFDDAKIEFAKNVACYANTSGGILIIGISDAPREVKGLTAIEDKLKTIDSVILEKTDYEGNLTESIPIKVQDDKGVDRECIAIVIKQSERPVGIKLKEGGYDFIVRNNTECIRTKLQSIENSKKGIVQANVEFMQSIIQFQ